ncbi:CDK-activating kinase assembly factor MAT1-like [Littorina saxatilis]|uniref:CDK-activating kinase assembly factor MAT1 n=1 Tax=Littorina saxatilis TaxID=31220 RepID=A0AAN9BHJ9_9CAEN
MEEQGCPRCKTTKYRNPSLKLMVNACGHSLCESCVDLLFIKGSGVCPECGVALRRNNYRLQVFEDAGVEKEVDIRKKVLRDFNKKEEDFGSLQDYNDYLEKVETIIFNLASGVEVESTRKMIEQYKKENKEFIKKNQSKLSRDEEYLEELIDMEKQEAASRKQTTMEEETREKALKRKHKDALIDELMFSDMPANAIMATHKQTSVVTKKEEETRPPPSAAPTFSTGMRFTQQSVFNTGGQVTESKPYVFTPLELETCGPPYPDIHSIMNDGFLSNVRPSTEMELAGGFEPQVACQRALQDTFCGLYYFPPMNQPCASPNSSGSWSQGNSNSPMCVS